jgi:DNA-directed RNA polymerase specialized sigma24 family protein
MNEYEINKYIKTHPGSINFGIKQFKRSMTEMGRRYSRDDLEDVAQELRIVMFKCLKNFKPLFHNTLETYISSSIYKNVCGKISDQLTPKHTKIYFDVSLSETVGNDDGYDELGNTIVDDRLPEEPRLDAVIFSDSLLALLDPVVRSRIYLWIDGSTYQDIGLLEGISKQAVEDSIRRAIDKLREIVDNRDK